MRAVALFLKTDYPIGNTHFNKKSAPQGALSDTGPDQE
jgi:hypothetical protein